MNSLDLLHNREIKFFSFINFINGFSFLIFPILFLYYLTKGMTPFEIGLLSAFWGASNILFEVPTGVVADVYGRKISNTIGWILLAIVTFLFPFATGFEELALLTFGIGLAGSFATGADQAWLVDNIKHVKLGNKLKEVLSITHMFRNLGMTFGFLTTTALVALYGLDSVWFAASAVKVIGVIFLVMWGRETYFKRHKHTMREELDESVEILRKSVNYTLKNKNLQNFFIAVAFVTSLLPLFLSTIHLKNLGFGDEWFGLLYTSWAFVGIFGSFLAPKVVDFLKSQKMSLIVLEATYAVFALMFALSGDLIFAIIGLVGGFFVLEIRIPIRDTVFHKQVPSAVRATMGSIYAIVVPISILVGNITLGAVAEADLRLAMIISILTIIPGIWFFSKLKE